MKRFCLLIAALVGVPLIGACSGATSPRIGLSAPTASLRDDFVNLRPYLAGRDHNIFLREELHGRSRSAETYPQVILSDRTLEGSFAASRAAVRSAALASSHESNGGTITWPTATAPSGAGFLLRLDPPLPEFPDSIESGQPFTARSQVQVFNDGGTMIGHGSVTRRIRLLGVDVVRAGGMAHEDAVRLRRETRLDLGWWFKARLDEDIWLAKGRGIVLRHERLSGSVFMVARFNAAYHHELQQADSVIPVGDKTKAPPIRSLTAMAVQFAEVFPHPRPAGFMLEWVAE